MFDSYNFTGTKIGHIFTFTYIILVMSSNLSNRGLKLELKHMIYVFFVMLYNYITQSLLEQCSRSRTGTVGVDYI